MSKHTPGPWEVYHDGYYDTWSVEGDGDTVADMWRLSEENHSRHPHADDYVEANARLIAAAPELLHLCVESLDDLCRCDAGDSPLAEKIRAAIAKATGAAP